MIESLKQLSPEKRKTVLLWTLVILGSAVIAFVFDQKSEPATILKPEAESPESAATFIPAGFVLVPIEVANYESLDSILGKFGVVDLYSAPLDPKARPKKVAERVKILRAPLNPNHFAVLAREEDSASLVGVSGPLTVVVQNPNRSGEGVVTGVANKVANGRGDVVSKSSSRKRLSRVTIEVMNADNPTTPN